VIQLTRTFFALGNALRPGEITNYEQQYAVRKRHGERSCATRHETSGSGIGPASLMLTGKRYGLNAATLAIESGGNKRTAITIKEGEIVEVIRGPRLDDTRMVDIKWNGKELVMFVQDLYDRGQYIVGRTAGA